MFSNKLCFYYRDSPLSVTNNNKLREKLKAVDLQIKEIDYIIKNLESSDVQDVVLKKMIISGLKK